MRLASFDVGIKNLAYCVFDVSAPQRQIVSWTVANLLAPETPAVSYTCTQELTRKRKSDAAKPCGKVAKYQSPTHAHHYCCETHAKKSTEWILPKKDYTLSKLKNKTLPVLQSAAREHQIDCCGLKKLEIAEKLAVHYEGRTWRLLGTSADQLKKAGETDLITIGRAIKRVLDADMAMGGVTHVIIENQISTIASRMKTIQGMIAQYFIMQAREIQVEFVSSHNKLKGYVLPSETTQTQTQTQEYNTDRGERSEPLEGVGKGFSAPSLEGGLRREPLVPSYRANKSDGVAICRELLNTTPTYESWKPILEASKKKDDLADCFLQGVWWISTR